uniref:E3 ubiquitin-protein ligase KCMF1 n=1 Tax=Gadus morhua TaxID=8049 RepID=A0A8C4ZKR8_GADMO
MSRHEGVSCDACLKGNFRGRRFKCLICYDYDLCASCYEGGATTTRHTAEHPMQCILTRVDYDLYYGGDNFSVEQPQSFTCPYCGRMGYTETSLQEHVSSEHAETSTEVICPICAALPGGDPNHVTDDFTAHLTLEHRAPRDVDESSSVRHVRRMFHPGRGLGGPRARRTNMHFTSGSTGGLSSSTSSQSSTYTPSNREAMDPIAELLSQLSGVRRAAGGQINAAGPSASQLQQLQMQLQLERQQAQAARQQLEAGGPRHAARRGNHNNNHHGGGGGGHHHNPGSIGSAAATALPNPPHPAAASAAILTHDHAPGESNHNANCHGASQFLLARLCEPKQCEAERQRAEAERADHSLFVQELLLSTLMHDGSSSSSSSSSGGEEEEGGRRDFAGFGAMGCVDVMPLDVALERLELRERGLRAASVGAEPPPRPL